MLKILLIILSCITFLLWFPYTRRLIIETIVIFTDVEAFLMYGSFRESLNYVLKGGKMPVPDKWPIDPYNPNVEKWG